MQWYALRCAKCPRKLAIRFSRDRCNLPSCFWCLGIFRYTANEDCSEANSFKYKMKGEQCLPSCASIGGEATFPEACANHGMFDAGPAHDADFCCTKQQMCAARTPPACEDIGGSGDDDADSDDSSMTMIVAIVGVSHCTLFFARCCGSQRTAVVCAAVCLDAFHPVAKSPLVARPPRTLLSAMVVDLAAPLFLLSSSSSPSLLSLPRPLSSSRCASLRCSSAAAGPNGTPTHTAVRCRTSA